MSSEQTTAGGTGAGEATVTLDSAAAEELLGALSSATARSIVVALGDEPKTPSEVADAVDTSVQNVTHHLDQLEDAGLVTVVGTTVSDQGREMREYGPTAAAFRLEAGAGDEQRHGPGGQGPGESDRAGSGAGGGVAHTPDDARSGATGGRSGPGPVARGFLIGLAAAVGLVALALAARRLRAR